jgi:hypothetical protein
MLLIVQIKVFMSKTHEIMLGYEELCDIQFTQYHKDSEMNIRVCWTYYLDG